jgi:HKD family nuclease
VPVGSANLTGAGLEGNAEWNYLSEFEVNVGLGDEPSR